MRDNKQGTYMLIDVAITGGRNVIKKKSEKVLQYKDLTMQIQRLWKVNVKVMPAITGATGTISKSLRQYLSSIPEKHEIKEVQKTTTLGTSHLIRKVLP
jgi:hypothetical protein